MGFLSGIGAQARGLLGSDAFLDRLAQAQAFANRDAMRRQAGAWRAKPWKGGQTVAEEAAPPTAFRPAPIAGSWADHAGGYKGKRDSWRPVGSFFGGPK